VSRRDRSTIDTSLSFLDVISCGFGAIVLLLIIARVGGPTTNTPDLALQRQWVSAKQRIDQLSETLAEQRAALERQQRELAASRELYASRDLSVAERNRQRHDEQARLKLALQVLSEEQQRLLGPEFSRQDQVIGGIPVDSEYIIFVIDSSGSMQSAAWPRLQKEMINILEIYPTVKGLQIMNDMGQLMFAGAAGVWLDDSPAQRDKIIRRLNSWAPFSNSSPVEGIQAAIKNYYVTGSKISIYVMGDDFQGRSVRAVAAVVKQLNRDRNSDQRRVRIHAVGFPVQFAGGREPPASAVRFAHLMRELTAANGGTFIALGSLN
jgi:uncharacterized coiled-coil protein SlyX